MIVNSAICTLFEGNYHYGVAALTKSLYTQGFRGEIYAGYRGELPKWANSAKENKKLNWAGACTYDVALDLQLHFLPLETDYHLTNYKPDFILDISFRLANKADKIFFFDSDIIITSKWVFFEKWVECGVTLCEDINSPTEAYHPKRVAWRKYYSQKNIKLKFKSSIYVNGGFVGVHRNDINFVETWKILQDEMAFEIGGLGKSSLNGNTLPPEASNAFDPFHKTDQDALNATVEAWDGKISFLGKAAMGFQNGFSLMEHPLGPKPWNKKFINDFIKGIPPRSADILFWETINGSELQPVSNSMSKRMVILCKILKGLSRFYKKN